jgi:hypothetical protein
MTEVDMRELAAGGHPPEDGPGAGLPPAPAALPADRLYRAADLSALSFETTAEVEPIEGLVGQQRALDAISFGTRIEKPGFNLFVIGPSGARMQQAVETVLQEAARKKTRPSDWVYVNNFAETHNPIAIALPAGARRPVPGCDARADR